MSSAISSAEPTALTVTGSTLTNQFLDSELMVSVEPVGDPPGPQGECATSRRQQGDACRAQLVLRRA